MLTNENLRFINENTFQEATPPADRSRPLEWRRSFNTVAFETVAQSVEYLYTVNEVDQFAEFDQHPDQGSQPVVNTAAKRRIRINFSISQDKLRDSIFFTDETEKGSGVYQLRPTMGDIQISLSEVEPTEQHGPYGPGTYPGLAFNTNFEALNNSLCIEVGAPTSQLEEITAELKDGYSSVLQVVIGMQSFSYEVDDALRDWHHPRDLFVHGSAAPAVLLSVRLKFHRPEVPAVAEAPDGEEVADSTFKEPLPAPPLLPDYSSNLKSIKTALWVVAFLLLLRLLK